MSKQEFLENGWKLEWNDEMYEAAQHMDIQEYEEYRETQKAQASEAMRDLKGMYSGADALYEDTIINAVGEKFMILFKKFHMVETCGMINNRKLYAI